MICPKCNTEMYDEDMCPECGYKISKSDNRLQYEDKFKSCRENMEYNLVLDNIIKKKQEAFIQYFIVTCIALGIALFLMIPYNSYCSKTIQYIEAGNENMARKYYEKHIQGAASEENFGVFLDEYIQKLYKQYNEADIGYTEVYKKYSFIQKDLNYDGVRVYLSDIGRLSLSKSAYEEGYKNYNAKDYTKAISWFSKVIEEDANYEDAKEQIKQARNRNKSIYVDEINKVCNDNANKMQSSYEVLYEVCSAIDSGDISFDDEEINQKYGMLADEYVNELVNQKYSNIIQAKEVYENLKRAFECLKDDEDINTVTNKYNDVRKYIVREVTKSYEEYVSKKMYTEAYDILRSNIEYDENDVIKKNIDSLFDKIVG